MFHIICILNAASLFRFNVIRTYNTTPGIPILRNLLHFPAHLFNSCRINLGLPIQHIPFHIPELVFIPIVRLGIKLSQQIVRIDSTRQATNRNKKKSLGTFIFM